MAEAAAPPSASAPASVSPPSSLLRSCRLVAAPMVNASDPAWRMLLRRHAAQLVYTQMLDSRRFVHEPNYRREMFVVCPEDRPLIVQFAANDADTLVQAAKLVEPYCDGIDLNCGCPQRAARTGLFGAYLLDEEHHERVFSMLRAAKRALRVPVLVKIRLLPTLERTLAFCAGLRACAIDGLVVHGRTRGFVEERRKGPADLAQVRAVVDAMHAPPPPTTTTTSAVHDAAAASPAPSSALLVWSNGNVRCERDVRDNLATTGADGYMVGEALLNDPTLFERCDDSSGCSGTTAAQTLLATAQLTLHELRRKLAIIDEYVSELQRPTHSYYSPFAAAAVAGPDDDITPSAPLDVSSSSSFLRSSIVSDTHWSTPLVSFSTFLAHVYRVLNGGDGSSSSSARFLAHVQLADELLDATSLAEVRTVLRQAEERMAAGRAFDPALQERIEANRAARQAARVVAQRRMEQQSSGVRVLNSKQRKRARWQQRKADAKRLKEEEGGAAAQGQELAAPASAPSDLCDGAQHASASRDSSSDD